MLLELELEFELELLLEFELELELEFELELLLEFELELLLELLLEFEDELLLELLLEFELELLPEFELELLLELELEFELPPQSSSLVLTILLLRNRVPPVSGGAERSTPGPMTRLRKLIGPSSAAADVAIALVDTKVAAMIFFRRIPVLHSGRRPAVAASRTAREHTSGTWARGFPAGRPILANF